MSAGQFSHRLQFQVLALVDDGMGGQTEGTAWENLLEVWASVLPAGANQRLAAGLLQTELTHRIRCWYRRDLLLERRALRAVDPDGPIYAVKGVRDADGRRLWLDCDAVQVSQP